MQKKRSIGYPGDIGAPERMYQLVLGAWKLCGASKCFFCARKGSAMMCCSDKKGASETAVVVGLSGRGVPKVCTIARP